MDLKLTHVPYKGSALATIDLVSGRVQFYVTSIPASLPHVRVGRVGALAETGERRNPALPGVPTVIESGLKDYRADSWYGLAFPRGVPAAIVKRVGDLEQKGLAEGGLAAMFAEQGLEMRRNVMPKEAADFLRKDIAHWANVVRRAGIIQQSFSDTHLGVIKAGGAGNKDPIADDHRMRVADLLLERRSGADKASGHRSSSGMWG